jgi:hypothetical protein
MANPNPPTTVSIETLAGYANAVREIALQLDHLVERMKSQDMTEISTINFPSGQSGRKSMESFVNAANSAFWSILSKDPSITVVSEPKKKYAKKASSTAEEIAEQAMKKLKKIPK